ncbi:MAG: 2-hydroxyacid dehydrogenase [Planktomarina sp.]
MLNVLFAAPQDRYAQYEHPLKQSFAAAGLDAHLSMDHAPGVADYIVYAPNSGLDDFTPYTRCKAVLNLWAGVETVVNNPTLTQPFCRMVDEGLSAGMMEWVTGHVLRHHLGMDAHIINPGQLWEANPAPLAKDRPVTILGMGALGSVCAKALDRLGFPVTGWSKTPKSIENVRCFHGDAGLQEALTDAQIVVLLLPDTPETRHVINVQSIAWMAKGAVLINPGRGPLIDDDAVISALKGRHLSHATLDAFEIEPLPADHPYWHMPNVTVTPHIASVTRPDTASQVIAENIKRSEEGLPLLHLVNRQAGY